MASVTVLYFAAARDRVGLIEEAIELPEALDDVDLRAYLARRHPPLANLLPSCRFAIDEEFAAPGAVALRDGTCLAVIPPVSGG